MHNTLKAQEYAAFEELEKLESISLEELLKVISADSSAVDCAADSSETCL